VHKIIANIACIDIYYRIGLSPASMSLFERSEFLATCVVHGQNAAVINHISHEMSSGRVFEGDGLVDTIDTLFIAIFAILMGSTPRCATGSPNRSDMAIRVSFFRYIALLARLYCMFPRLFVYHALLTVIAIALAGKLCLHFVGLIN